MCVFLRQCWHFMIGWQFARWKRLRFETRAGLFTRRCANVRLSCLRALEVFKCSLSVYTPRFTERTKCFGKTALHDSDDSAWRKVSVFNTMKVIRYTTVVDSDVDYDPRKFGTEVDIYLADPDGWAQRYSFVRGPGKTIRLCSPKTIGKVGCGDEKLSCATLGGNEIWLNSDRWLKGATPSKLPLERYRQYMVTHEMGHSLGYDHVKCPRSGPAPLMMQQTLGIGNCSPNTKLTRIDLIRNL